MLIVHAPLVDSELCDNQTINVKCSHPCGCHDHASMDILASLYRSLNVLSDGMVDMGSTCSSSPHDEQVEGFRRRSQSHVYFTTTSNVSFCFAFRLRRRSLNALSVRRDQEMAPLASLSSSNNVAAVSANSSTLLCARTFSPLYSPPSASCTYTIPLSSAGRGS